MAGVTQMQLERGGGGDALTSPMTSDKKMVRDLHLPRELRHRSIYGVTLLDNEPEWPDGTRNATLPITRTNS